MLGKGQFYLTIAFVLAGSSVVAARYVADALAPFTITFLSLAFAVVTALAVEGRAMLSQAKQLSRFHWQVLFLQALFGVFLFRVFLTFALQFSSAAEVGIITGVSPAITALLTWLFLQDRLGWQSVVGVLSTLLGMVILQLGWPVSLHFQPQHLFGNLLALGAASCESIFTTLARKAHVSEREKFLLPAVVHSGLVSVIALCLCFVPMLLEAPWPAIAALQWDSWLALFWYGSIVTIIAFACMFTGAKYCDGYTIAAFTGLIPVSALVLSIIVLGEPVLLRHWLGCACITFAIVLLSWRLSG